eukprot:363534-Chlamydomonas_euryale.AAC.7
MHALLVMLRHACVLGGAAPFMLSWWCGAMHARLFAQSLCAVASSHRTILMPTFTCMHARAHIRVQASTHASACRLRQARADSHEHVRMHACECV